MVGRLLEIPTSVSPTDAVRALRLLGEARGWSMKRLEESRMVHRWAIIMPLTSQAQVLGLEFEDGLVLGLSLRTWSHTPGSAGRLTHVSFEIPAAIEGEFWTEILDEWSSRLPRCPWRWTFGERSMIGYLLPEYRRSRVLFGREGIDLKNWASREESSTPSSTDD